MLQKVETPQDGPILSDGRALSDLIDRDRREVSQRVFHDAEIYQLELEHIWAKTWIAIGHESEIPNPGDFVTRRIGDDSVIVVRERDGKVGCKLNVCPHRGTVVCRSEAGNATLFRCIYHGWMFNLDGSLRGIPMQNEMYPDGIDQSDKARLGLRSARVEVFAGIIFANWDDNAEPLSEFLGDYSLYLNMIMNKTGRGYEVLGPPQRFVINANWKTASEQFASDAAHANQLHRSLADISGLDRNNPAHWQMYAPKVSSPQGHSVICFDLRGIYESMAEGRELSPMEKMSMLPPPGMTVEQVPALAEQFSPAELQLLADTPPSNGGMFPNVGLWNSTGFLPDRSLAGYCSLRTYVPLGMDKFEFTMWMLVAKDAPQELRDRVRRTGSFMQGASGFVEGDDAEVWPGTTHGAVGFIGRQNTMKYWPMSGHNPPEGWPGGGNVHTGLAMDDTQWAWWQHYFACLNNEA
jgi:nitrite reductase/ring-hydroxylating ferredoxin subunit